MPVESADPGCSREILPNRFGCEVRYLAKRACTKLLGRAKNASQDGQFGARAVRECSASVGVRIAGDLGGADATSDTDLVASAKALTES